MSGLELDMDRVRELMDEGYISVRKHPTAPLFIYNYTPKCQFDWHWTPETIVCRGLILDDQDNVVARPFPKFFTPSQLKDLRNHVHHLYGLRYKELYQGGFSVTDKVDGSMGVVYYHPDCGVGVATRGSFESDQAKHASELMREEYGTFPFVLGFTYVFEIVYPENRIVVNYGKRDELVLLTVLDNNTGEDNPSLVEEWRSDGHPTVRGFNFQNFDDVLKEQGGAEAEGFVVKFDNGLRVKVKFEEYLRLHRIITNVSERSIWKSLSDGESLDDMLELVPDEFYNWVKKVEADLWARYHEIELDAFRTLRLDTSQTRKEFALKHKDYKYKGILFQMLDDKSYSDSIWMLVKPKARN